jgi:hypothetical protein
VTEPLAQGGPWGAREWSPGGPKEPQEGSWKESGSEKSCESKRRCSLKRRKTNQSKGVLAALREPGGTLGPENGPYSVPGEPREARRAEQDLIDVLKTGRNKEKRGALPRTQENQQKDPRGPPKGPIMNIKGPHWGLIGSLGPSRGPIKILRGPKGLLGGPITNLKGPIGAFRASSGPLGSPIRVLWGSHCDAFGAPSRPLGDPIGALRGHIRELQGTNRTSRAPLQVP